MDNYTEQLLDCKPSEKSVRMLIIGISTIVTGFFVMFAVWFLLGLLLVIAGFVLHSFGKKGQSSEFEYLFINGDLEIARINNKESRKNIFSMQESDVKRILPYESPKGKNELEVNKSLTVMDFTSGNKNNSGSWYIFLANKKNGTNAVILELDERNVEHCKNVFKQKFEK